MTDLFAGADTRAGLTAWVTGSSDVTGCDGVVARSDTLATGGENSLVIKSCESLSAICWQPASDIQTTSKSSQCHNLRQADDFTNTASQHNLIGGTKSMGCLTGEFASI
jgi:hypothetical protein